MVWTDYISLIRPIEVVRLELFFDIKEDPNGKEAYKPEEIVALRQVDVLVSRGNPWRTQSAKSA